VQIKWQRVNDYHAKWRDYTLAKGFIYGVPRYVLYESKILVRGFESSSEAAEWINQQETGNE
jgi:hypothetical protein